MFVILILSLIKINFKKLKKIANKLHSKFTVNIFMHLAMYWRYELLKNVLFKKTFLQFTI